MMEKARVISEAVNARQTEGLEDIHFACEYGLSALQVKP